MAAVSDGRGDLGDFIDYELQRQLKGLNTTAPDLSTLAQKGDDKVIIIKHLYVNNELICEKCSILFSITKLYAPINSKLQHHRPGI